ncbi:hypothetical protein BGW39_001620 [Mortierella sp. 14UC]|nr:hypothetical protein BGW39_001620 [Mortierella sp. 14UC]
MTTIEPRCIRLQRGVTLTVVVGELSPPTAEPARSRSPIAFAQDDSAVFDDAPPTHIFNFPTYAASEASSQVTANHGQPRVPLKARVEGENDSVLGEDDTDSIVASMEVINITGSSRAAYYQPSIEGNNIIATNLTAIETADAFLESRDTTATAIAVSKNNINNNINNSFNSNNPIDRSITPPLSISSSESGTSSSGVSTSTTITIPPISIVAAAAANEATATTAATGTGEVGETPAAATATTAAATAAAVPEPAEIDPVEATSSWASIFRTLGDLQEQFQLAPEDTVKMFTEITQST